MESGIPLILWLGESEVKEGVVKVKSLSKHEEYIIKRDEFKDKIVDIVRDNPILLPQALQSLKKEEEKQ